MIKSNIKTTTQSRRNHWVLHANFKNLNRIGEKTFFPFFFLRKRVYLKYAFQTFWLSLFDHQWMIHHYKKTKKTTNLRSFSPIWLFLYIFNNFIITIANWCIAQSNYSCFTKSQKNNKDCISLFNMWMIDSMLKLRNIRWCHAKRIYNSSSRFKTSSQYFTKK